MSSGPCRMVVLNPPAGEHRDVLFHDSRISGQGLNNRSVVTRLTGGNHTILFVADIERDGLSRMTRASSHGPIEVLKVPHHGAVSSLNRDWLASLHPQYAVFSAGRHNSYRHPDASVLYAYGSEGSTVLRTDHDGGCGLLGEFPTHRSMCTGRETWYGRRRTKLRACGLANRRIRIGFGNNGATVIDHRFAESIEPGAGPLQVILDQSERMRECTFNVLARHNSALHLPSCEDFIA